MLAAVGLLVLTQVERRARRARRPFLDGQRALLRHADPALAANLADELTRLQVSSQALDVSRRLLAEAEGRGTLTLRSPYTLDLKATSSQHYMYFDPHDETFIAMCASR